MAFITNYLQNTAATYLSAGVTAVGSMAGNAVGGVGSLVESGGRSIGEGSVNGGIRSVGQVINGYGDKVINATASQGTPPVNSNAPKAAVKAPTQTNGYTKKALPANSSKSAIKGPAPQKAISAPPAKPSTASTAKSVPSGKTVVSAASKPKPAGVGAAKPTLGQPKPYTSKPVSASSVPKPPTGPVPAGPKAPTNKGGVNTGKVKVSAASRPKK